MMLTTWTPMTTDCAPHSIETQVDRLLHDALGWPGKADGRAWRLPINAYEQGDRFVVQVECPGMTEKEIELTVEKGVLHLKGERTVPFAGEEASRTHRRETWHGRFERSLTLPDFVDAEAASAQYLQGMLTITFPKKAEAQPRRIPVTSGAPGQATAPAAGSGETSA